MTFIEFMRIFAGLVRGHVTSLATEEFAKQWFDWGFTPEMSARWANEGFTPTEAIREMATGETIEKMEHRGGHRTGIWRKGVWIV